ncbi:MAG: hypothetical protein K1X82_09120 [Bacteroidia bacterium]|nr:hypothetical protein [Bacteroidia bacterium]
MAVVNSKMYLRSSTVRVCSPGRDSSGKPTDGRGISPGGEDLERIARPEPY